MQGPPVRAASERYGGQLVAVQPPGRRCVFLKENGEECKKRLSQYNKEPYCNSHPPHLLQADRERRRREGLGVPMASQVRSVDLQPTPLLPSKFHIRERGSMVTPADLIEAVVQETQVPYTVLTGNRNRKDSNVVLARRFLVYLLVTDAKISEYRIVKLLDRSKGFVALAMQVMRENLRSGGSEIQKKIEAIRARYI